LKQCCGIRLMLYPGCLCLDHQSKALPVSRTVHHGGVDSGSCDLLDGEFQKPFGRALTSYFQPTIRAFGTIREGH
jgi:hypothetical protein